MAEIPYVALLSTAWTNLTAAASFIVAQNMLVQNRGGSQIRVITAVAQPAADAAIGLLFNPYDIREAVPGVGESVWAISNITGGQAHVDDA